MKFQHLVLSLALVGACDTSTTEDSSTDLSASAASELSDAHIDGVPGLGPRPAHALIRDCSALASAPADRPPPPRGHGRHGEAGTSSAAPGRPARLHGFARLYDVDASGTLDEAELAALDADRAAGCEARNARLLAAYDADGDGALSDAELEVAQAAIDAELEAKRAEALASFDADGDGALSREERQAMRDQKRAELIAQFDANGDGSLDATEEAALAESIKAQIRDGTAHGFGGGHHHH